MLIEEFPNQGRDRIEDRIAVATDILLLGNTLGRTLDVHWHQLEGKLGQQPSVRVLLVDQAARLSISLWPDPPSRLQRTKKSSKFKMTLERLKTLKAAKESGLQVRLINYPLAYGGIAIDPQTRNGILFLWYHSFKSTKPKLPKLIARSSDHPWFEHYRDEINALWQQGKVC